MSPALAEIFAPGRRAVFLSANASVANASQMGWTASEPLRKAMDEVKGALATVRRASAAAAMGMPLDAAEHGPFQPLREVSTTTDAARLLVLEARMQLESGDTASATENLAACLRLARLMAAEPSPLAPTAASIVLGNTSAMIGLVARDPRKMTAEQVRTLRDELARFDTEDPLGFRASVGLYADLAARWLPARVGRAGPGSGSMADAIFDEALKQAGSREKLEREGAPGLRRLAEEADGLFADPPGLDDPQAPREPRANPEILAALEKIRERARAGEFGPLAAAAQPGLAQAYTGWWASRRQIREARERVAFVLGGLEKRAAPAGGR
ncbi:MAG: hypothetical protein IBJ11_10780 [Phycisphaerales bacterium]|nr:hypothetical protein [Phycisphaerales bacterium]